MINLKTTLEVHGLSRQVADATYHKEKFRPIMSQYSTTPSIISAYNDDDIIFGL